MIVDPASRTVVADSADAPGALRAREGVYIGTLPETIGIANTAVTWQSRRWTMLRWPVPADHTARAILLMHESWHRIQDALGLAGREADQSHLASAEGRVAMRLELRALARAITVDDAGARAALCDALLFRAHREQLGAAVAANEAALERNEGLAEYTGWTVSGALANRDRLKAHIARGEAAPALARSFAYFTGPAYGALLDRYAPGWRTRVLARSRFAELLPDDIRRCPGTGSYERAGSTYGRVQILREERDAAAQAGHAQARWRSHLIEGPILTLPMQEVNIVFDPNAVVPLGSAGNVYPHIEAHGPWGTLIANDGALVDTGWTKLVVAARAITQAPRVIRTAGWRLDLKPGWSLRPAGPARWQIDFIPSQGANP